MDRLGLSSYAMKLAGRGGQASQNSWVRKAHFYHSPGAFVLLPPYKADAYEFYWAYTLSRIAIYTNIGVD